MNEAKISDLLVKLTYFLTELHYQEKIMTYYKVVSIHGVPRSGTSWLGQIFNAHSDVAYRFQPLFSYRFKDRLSVNSSPEDVNIFLDELYKVTDDDFIAGKWSDSNKDQALPRTTYHKKNLPEVLVIKEVRYHHLIENLINSVLNITMIGIVRNPCAVINSWLQSPKEFKNGWDASSEWRFAPSKNQNRIEEFNGYEKWKELTLSFLELENKYPATFTLIQYEHLVQKPVETIKMVFQFCGLKMEDQVLDFIKSSQSHHIDDAYAVYKSPSVKDRWRSELDHRIIEEITTDITGTVLERFLI